MGRKYCVYILYSDRCSQFYVGQTSDLAARLCRHNTGQVTSTRRYCPWRIVYSEQFETRAEAMRKEKWLKSGEGLKFRKTILQL